MDTEAYKTKINAEFAGDAKGIDVFYWWGAGTAKKLVDAGKVMALALREVGATGVNEMLSGKKEFGDEGYKKAAQKVSDLYKLGAFGENPLEQGNDDANAAFENGKAAMRIMGSWFANNVYTDEAATVNPEEVVALKIPMISDGNGESTDYCGGYVESFWVNNNTKYKEEAAKFCSYRCCGRNNIFNGSIRHCQNNMETKECCLWIIYDRNNDTCSGSITSIIPDS